MDTLSMWDIEPDKKKKQQQQHLAFSRPDLEQTSSKSSKEI